MATTAGGRRRAIADLSAMEHSAARLVEGLGPCWQKSMPALNDVDAAAEKAKATAIGQSAQLARNSINLHDEEALEGDGGPRCPEPTTRRQV